MQLVERHLVRLNHPYFNELNNLTFYSKELYNVTLYTVRQEFFNSGTHYNYYSLYHVVKNLEQYRYLPAKVAQQTIKLVAQNWKAWRSASHEWSKSPNKFLGKPKLPKYLPYNGRQVVTYTRQAISFANDDYIRLSKTEIWVNTQIDYEKIQQVRIVPKGTCYAIEVVYNVEEETENNLDYDLVAGIDLGLNNLATVASNKAGFIPFFVNGRPLKSLNQYYNWQRAHYQSLLPENQYTSRRLQLIAEKRNRRIKHYLHVASRFIINDLLNEGIGTLVIGRNKQWKQKINIGKRNNQNFTMIPHYMFIRMLTYKAQLAGIQVIETEESYTSKCSFLDLEPIGKHDVYAGRRIKRGLFRSSNGTLINADVNGALNIIRKAIPKSFDGIEDVVVYPDKINLRT